MWDNRTVSFRVFNRLLRILVRKIQANRKFVPDTIVALSTGGFTVAVVLAKQLGISSHNVVGIPVYKDEAGDYHIDERLVRLGNFAGRRVLVVDEASNRGELTRKVVIALRKRGATAKSAVLISWVGGIQPDFVAATRPGKPPKFYWES